MAATTPDPTAVAAACKDDLGRGRQDELPLSTRLRNGPSFISNYDHHANHYDNPFKDSLHTSWSVAIKDEESERMAGLIIPDARPWANDVSVRDMWFGPQSTVFKSGSSTSQKHAQAAVPNSKPKLTQATKSATNTSVPVGQRGNEISYNEIEKESESSAMHLLLDGDCTISPDQGFGVQPKFKIHANTVTNTAFLTFINQKKKKEFDYNVLDLSTPELKGEQCHIAKIRGENQGQFRVQLSTKEKAQHFLRILYNIQQSALVVQADMKNPSPVTVPVSPCLSKSAVHQTGSGVKMSSSPTATSHTAPKTPTATKAREIESVKNITTNETIENHSSSEEDGSEKPENSQVGWQPVLIDLNVTPTQGPSKTYPIDELAEDLYDFVATMRWRLRDSATSPFAANYSEVEDAAFAIWAQKDSVRASEPPLKKCLPQFLDLLCKLDPDSNNGQVMPAEPLKIDSLLDFDDSSSTSSAARLRYSARQIMRMRSHAASFSVDNCSSNPVVKKQRTEIDGLAAIQQFKGWLGNQSQENAIPQHVGFKVAQGTEQTANIKSKATVDQNIVPSARPSTKENAADVAKSTTDTKLAAPIKPPIAAPAKPKLNGLASSRWAN